MLHFGHSDKVFLGTPVAICILSRLLSSRPGAQDGLGNSPGKDRVYVCGKFHATFDAARKGEPVLGTWVIDLRSWIDREERDGLELRQLGTLQKFWETILHQLSTLLLK